jgi:hypothetical protein
VSLAELKHELEHLTPAERRHLTAHLVALERRVDPEFQRELTRKIDDHTPDRWLTVEEAESRLLE